ncbi:MAG: tRNA (adenosine(37)-N6)-threonylcarbamoyltransferase complex dimerization subunit type 1 TsaB [Clostridia bacterium]|nr:tRNA (adenosine(37)-N6)-threonylcarbamoyltransferase complex dimerization subunit type 1 TsaB [Clostridia bacterium]
MTVKNFLAVDTSGSALIVVAKKDGKTFTSYTPDCAMKHSVLLMDAIDETLDKANLTLSECDFFSAVVGAGSFTGIRIGVSAMKGFALAMGKPTLPVTSFACLEYNAVEGKTLCLIDALHGYYYVCGYENGKITYPPAYVAEEEVLALYQQGYALRAFTKLGVAEKAPVEIMDGGKGLLCAVETLANDNAFDELNPLYIRKSSAEENLCK